MEICLERDPVAASEVCTFYTNNGREKFGRGCTAMKFSVLVHLSLSCARVLSHATHTYV